MSNVVEREMPRIGQNIEEVLSSFLKSLINDIRNVRFAIYVGYDYRGRSGEVTIGKFLVKTPSDIEVLVSAVYDTWTAKERGYTWERYHLLITCNGRAIIGEFFNPPSNWKEVLAWPGPHADCWVAALFDECRKLDINPDDPIKRRLEKLPPDFYRKLREIAKSEDEEIAAFMREVLKT